MHLYKDHTIISLGDFDVYTGKFIPVASITWNSNGNRAEHVLTSSERCLTHLYAMALALDEAKSWVDRRLESVAKMQVVRPLN